MEDYLGYLSNDHEQEELDELKKMGLKQALGVYEFELHKSKIKFSEKI